jgi:uncharacterized protein
MSYGGLVDSDVFYATAATVIPLLLISVIATRSWRPGELQQQPASALLIFGIPVIGEVAAFAFLFFEPVPTAGALILSILTWAGLLSQLGLATWWLTSLISGDAPTMEKVNSDASTAGKVNKEQRLALGNCPLCNKKLSEARQHLCEDCSKVMRVGQEELIRASIEEAKLADRKAREAQSATRTGSWRESMDIFACPACHASLREDEVVRELVCTSPTCGLAYPIYNDRPYLLIQAARRPEKSAQSENSDTPPDGTGDTDGATTGRASELPRPGKDAPQSPPEQDGMGGNATATATGE